MFIDGSSLLCVSEVLFVEVENTDEATLSSLIYIFHASAFFIFIHFPLFSSHFGCIQIRIDFSILLFLLSSSPHPYHGIVPLIFRKGPTKSKMNEGNELHFALRDSFGKSYFYEDQVPEEE